MNWIYIEENIKNENFYFIITMRNYLISTGYGQGKSRIIRSYYNYNNPSIQLSHRLLGLFHYTRVVKMVLSPSRVFLVLGQVQP